MDHDAELDQAPGTDRCGGGGTDHAGKVGTAGVDRRAQHRDYCDDDPGGPLADRHHADLAEPHVPGPCTQILQQRDRGPGNGTHPTGGAEQPEGDKVDSVTDPVRQRVEDVPPGRHPTGEDSHTSVKVVQEATSNDDHRG